MADEITIGTLAMAAEIVETGNRVKNLVRIPPRLFQAHPQAYVPLFVSVGPFHHIRPYSSEVQAGISRFKDVNILASETNKQACMLKLLRFLHDLGFINMSELLQKFKRHVRGKLDEIWSLYLKEIEICHEPLANIIILDSCFLLGFLASGAKDIMFSAFRRDLALLENQVPFFVLVDFSFMISNHVASKIHLGLLILHTFKLCPTFHLSPGYLDSGENIYAKELGEDPYLSHVAKRVHDHVPDSIHLLDFIYRYHALQISARIEHNVPSKIPSSRAVRLRNATKLSASGVTIECAEFNHFHSVLNLSFSEGGLSIPPLLISDYTETLFINLLAHEHLSPSYRDYFTSYVFLMAQLIESEGDLQLLESFTMSLEVGGM